MKKYKAKGTPLIDARSQDEWEKHIKGPKENPEKGQLVTEYEGLRLVEHQGEDTVYYAVKRPDQKGGNETPAKDEDSHDTDDRNRTHLMCRSKLEEMKEYDLLPNIYEELSSEFKTNIQHTRHFRDRYVFMRPCYIPAMKELFSLCSEGQDSGVLGHIVITGTPMIGKSVLRILMSMLTYNSVLKCEGIVLVAFGKDTEEHGPITTIDFLDRWKPFDTTYQGHPVPGREYPLSVAHDGVTTGLAVQNHMSKDIGSILERRQRHVMLIDGRRKIYHTKLTTFPLIYFSSPAILHDLDSYDGGGELTVSKLVIPNWSKEELKVAYGVMKTSATQDVSHPGKEFHTDIETDTQLDLLWYWFGGICFLPFTFVTMKETLNTMRLKIKHLASYDFRKRHDWDSEKTVRNFNVDANSARLFELCKEDSKGSVIGGLVSTYTVYEYLHQRRNYINVERGAIEHVFAKNSALALGFGCCFELMVNETVRMAKTTKEKISIP